MGTNRESTLAAARRDVHAVNALHALEGNAWRRERILAIERQAWQMTASLWHEAARLASEAVEASTADSERTAWLQYCDHELPRAQTARRSAHNLLGAIGDLYRYAGGSPARQRKPPRK